uniref:Putative defensin c n=1 Tax=Rhodnius prolixus TaxID=13249 RepID=R4G4L8_RHOPR
MKCILSLVTLFLVATMVYSYPTVFNLQQQLGKIPLNSFLVLNISTNNLRANDFQTVRTKLDDALRKPSGEITEEHLARMKRATCDLFSFESKWFTTNHAACAAHCIFLGYKGGNCQDTICHCRD